MKAICVLTGDPALPYRYNASGRFEQHDLDAINQVKAALAGLPGYHFSYWQTHSELINRCLSSRPDLVLNLCNAGYRNRPQQQLHVTALLEMLDIPFAGVGPEGLALCHDKALVTAAAADLGIPVPDTQLIELSDQPPSPNGDYPRMIKLNDESGSTGITDQSVVASARDAQRHMARLNRQFPERWVLAQTFLTGMEISVG
ncbi:MAG: D-alanine--D-alanine ligase, partial [Pseudomonadota bacterium]